MGAWLVNLWQYFGFTIYHSFLWRSREFIYLIDDCIYFNIDLVKQSDEYADARANEIDAIHDAGDVYGVFEFLLFWIDLLLFCG